MGTWFVFSAKFDPFWVKGGCGGGGKGKGLGVRFRMKDVFATKIRYFGFFVLWLVVATKFTSFWCDFGVEARRRRRSSPPCRSPKSAPEQGKFGGDP